MTVSYNVNTPIKGNHFTPLPIKPNPTEREIMENLIIAIFIYVAAVAIAFAPKCPHVSPDSPVEKIEYFPEIETTDEPAKKSHLVNLPGEPVTPSPAPVSLPTAIAAETSLHGLSIRELKKRASQAKIKRYGTLNNQQLILALT
jgi:hypothetical protein